MRRYHGHVALSLSCGMALLMTLPGLPSPGAGGSEIPGSDGRIPISFEANAGQTDSEIRFYTRGPGFGLYLTSAEAVMTCRSKSDPRSLVRQLGLACGAVRPLPLEDRVAVVRMQFHGANPEPALAGEQEELGRSHYLFGSDPQGWYAGVKRFRRVRYQEIYPGIDLVFYGQNGELEYDFVVEPGADPEAIRLGFTGDIDKLAALNGDLVLETPAGEIRQRRPKVYQPNGDGRSRVEGSFKVSACERDPGIFTHTVGFQLGAYDPNRPLVIDPALSYATHLGGRDFDIGRAIAVDAEGNTYITGATASLDFPTDDALQGRNGGGFFDVFITKLNSTGTAIIYSTFVGGGGVDDGYGIVVDAQGNAYVTGLTNSVNFPTVNAVQPLLRSVTDRDAFILKLNPEGDGLVYSTYLGGSDGDAGRTISLGDDGSTYIAGETNSTNFPTVKAFQSRLGGSVDGFVAELSPAGDVLAFSSYLGGRLDDFAESIAGNGEGQILVTGETSSFNLSTPNAFQPTYAGGQFDAFAAGIDTAEGRLVYLTYLGGRGNDFGSGITTDPLGNVYIAGWTLSSDFPTVRAWQSMNKGGSDAFLAKLSRDGTDLLYASYLGGRDADNGMSIALDSSGNVVMAGFTSSVDFPLVEPLRPALGGDGDLFVVRFNSGGTALLFSTFLGGQGGEGFGGAGLAVGRNGDIYVTDSTFPTGFATGFPTTPGAFQQEYGGGPTDAIVVRIVN